jgi:hypothetical protein
MGAKQQYFGGVEDAIAKLGNPNTIWFRGHSASHRLVPALFRFPNGANNESKMFELYKRHPSTIDGKAAENEESILLCMHHNYFPTRLLAWTGSLHVALFCALVRESDNPALFILDPVALNAYSKLPGHNEVEFSHSIGPEFSIFTKPVRTSYCN